MTSRDLLGEDSGSAMLARFLAVLFILGVLGWMARDPVLDWVLN